MGGRRGGLPRSGLSRYPGGCLPLHRVRPKSRDSGIAGVGRDSMDNTDHGILDGNRRDSGIAGIAGIAGKTRILESSSYGSGLPFKVLWTQTRQPLPTFLIPIINYYYR